MLYSTILLGRFVTLWKLDKVMAGVAENVSRIQVLVMQAGILLIFGCDTEEVKVDPQQVESTEKTKVAEPVVPKTFEEDSSEVSDLDLELC